MTRKAILFSALMAGSLLLSACGDDEPAPAPVEPSVSASPTPTEEPTIEPKVNPEIIISPGLPNPAQPIDLPLGVWINVKAAEAAAPEVEELYQDRKIPDEQGVDASGTNKNKDWEYLTYTYDYIPAVKTKGIKESWRLTVLDPKAPEEAVVKRKDAAPTTYNKVQSSVASPQMEEFFNTFMSVLLEEAYYSTGNALPKVTVKEGAFLITSDLTGKPISLKPPAGLKLLSCSGSLSKYNCGVEDTYAGIKVIAEGNQSQQTRSYYGTVSIDLGP